MKVSATVRVDIDTDAWTRDYGCASAEVRDDVKGYIENLVHEHFQGLGLLKAARPDFDARIDYPERYSDGRPI